MLLCGDARFSPRRDRDKQRCPKRIPNKGRSDVFSAAFNHSATAPEEVGGIRTHEKRFPSPSCLTGVVTTGVSGKMNRGQKRGDADSSPIRRESNPSVVMMARCSHPQRSTEKRRLEKGEEETFGRLLCQLSYLPTSEEDGTRTRDTLDVMYSSSRSRTKTNSDKKCQENNTRSTAELLPT